MKIIQTRLPGVVVIEVSNSFIDHRGAFTRFFCERELIEVIGHRHIVQINHSCTMNVGSVRGLHYQNAPHAEMKLVRCVKGRVWDVVVDIRAGSPTYLQWHAEELSPTNMRMIVVPEGCAHGFQVLESPSDLFYLSTAFYEPLAENGLNCQDPMLAITWPLPVMGLSQNDSQRERLTHEFTGIRI